MGTKNNPGEFDCYANAEPDEPVFVLLARDVLAPGLVQEWARRRESRATSGQDPFGPDTAQKTMEARQCAEAMRRWRKEHRPVSTTTKGEATNQ